MSGAPQEAPIHDPCTGSGQLVALLLEVAMAALREGADVGVVTQIVDLANSLNGMQLVGGGE